MTNHASSGVIIPAYNCASYISEALESLEKQSRRPDRVVVVNDGSTDHTGAVVTRFSQRTALKIDYIYQPNQGIAAARNNGVERCNTTYIAFLDGDDAFYPTFLEKAEHALATHRELVLCFSDRHIVDDDHRVIKQTFDQPRLAALASKALGDGVRMLEDNPFITLVPGNVIPIGNLMLRTEMFRRIGGFDEDQRVVEDRPFLLTLAKKGPFGFIDEPLGIWRSHGTNTCGGSNAFRMMLYADRALDKIASRAADLGLDNEELQAIVNERAAIPSQLLYIAASAARQEYLRLAWRFYRESRVSLKLLMRNTVRYTARVAQNRLMNLL